MRARPTASHRDTAPVKGRRSCTFVRCGSQLVLRQRSHRDFMAGAVRDSSTGSFVRCSENRGQVRLSRATPKCSGPERGRGALTRSEVRGTVGRRSGQDPGGGSPAVGSSPRHWGGVSSVTAAARLSGGEQTGDGGDHGRLDPARSRIGRKCQQPPARVGRGLLGWGGSDDGVFGRALPLTNTLAGPLGVTAPEVMSP